MAKLGPSLRCRSFQDAAEAMRKLKDVSKKVSPSGNLSGAIIRFHVADGYASYVVDHDYPTPTLTLHHIAYGDAWTVSDATIRGLRIEDVRVMIAQDRAWENWHVKTDDFYNNLTLGQTYHYDNGFENWVRCEGIERDGKKMLLPFELCGNWHKFDLPRCRPDGDIELGYYAEKIAKKEPFTPNESCIYEFPGSSASRKGNPKTLKAIDLSVPEMTDPEYRVATAVKAIEKCRDAARWDSLEPDDLRAVLLAIKSHAETGIYFINQ